MNPPVPPKTRLVDLERVGPDHFEVRFKDDHKNRAVYFTDDYGIDRMTVASISEVEWRKRAERWAKVAAHYVWAEREQFYAFERACKRRDQANVRVDQWRAWAEGK